MNTQTFTQTGQMIKLCCEYLSAWCIWLYVLIMSRTHFRVNPLWVIQIWIDKFKDLIIKKQVYKIPIQYLIDIGLVNFPESFSTRFIFTLENLYINHLNQMLKLLLYQNQTLRYIFMELLIFRTYKLNYMKTSKSISIHL